MVHCTIPLHKKCFWSASSHILPEYGEIWSISPYSVWMLENADQNNSEYGHVLRSVRERHIPLVWQIYISKSLEFVLTAIINVWFEKDIIEEYALLALPCHHNSSDSFCYEKWEINQAIYKMVFLFYYKQSITCF